MKFEITLSGKNLSEKSEESENNGESSDSTFTKNCRYVNVKRKK